MHGYIKSNKFNKYFIFILLATFFRFFNICLLGYDHFGAFEKVSLNAFLYDKLDNKKEFELSNYLLTELVLNYFGTFIFSLISRLYELKISGKKINQFFTINEKFLVEQRKISQFNIDKIDKKEFNLLFRFKNYLVNNSSICLFIIISFVWAVQQILMISCDGILKGLDFWFFEIIIVTIFFSNIFLTQVFKHHILALAINSFPCIFKIINIILSFISDDTSMIYLEYYWWIPVGLVFYLLLISINSFNNCTIKSFIDLKYASISQLLIFYSLVGIVICSVACVISTYVPCDKIEEAKIISKKTCKIKDNNNFTYFDNFIMYFSSFNDEDSTGKFIRIFIIILDSITFFFEQFFYMCVIKYLDPVHVTFCQPIFFILKKIVLIINNLIRNKEVFKNKLFYKPARFFFDITGDIISLIGYLIYLEIIELNICGLNYNLKKYISDRGLDNGLYKLDYSGTINTDDEEYNSESSELTNKKTN